MFVQRTEVLRGPQGTLYGRNSMGGSLNVISARPDDEWGAELRAVVGDYDTRRVEGYFTGPVTDNFRIRLSALSDIQSEGFVENLGVGGNYAAVDRSYYEGQFDWDVTENLNVWFRYTTSSWDDTMGVENGLQVYVSPYDTHQFAAPAGVVLSPQYNYCAIPGTPSPNPLLGGTPGIDECSDVGNAPAVNPSIANNYALEGYYGNPSSVHDNDAFVTNVNWDLGSGLNLRYVGGYARYNFTTGNDTAYTSRTFADGTPESYIATNVGAFNIALLGAPTAVFPQDRTFFRQVAFYHSNEINLSNGEDEAVHWILGLYQYHEKFEQQITLSQPNQPELRASNLLFYGDERDGEYGRSGGLITTNSYAVFGQTDWSVSDTLTATLGLRYTWDEKRGDEVYDVNFFNPITGLPGSLSACLDSNLQPVAGDPLAYCGFTALPVINGVINLDAALGGLEVPHQEDTWDATTGTLGLQWEPDDDTLIYGRYSRGYKAGGFLLGNGSSDAQFDPESVDAFEIGLKRDIGPSIRTNLSLFFNQYDSFQFALGSINPATGLSETRAVNVDAEAYGAEFELIWQPLDDLVFMANYSYLNTEITSGCNAVGDSFDDGSGGSATTPDFTREGCYFDGADIWAMAAGANPQGSMVFNGGTLWPSRDLQFQSVSGNDLPQAPEHKVAINGNYTFHFEPGDLTLSATYFWTDSVTYGIFANPAYRVPAYDTADFRAIFNDADGNFTLIGYVKNAFDEVAYTSNGPTNPGQTYEPASGAPLGVGITRGLIWPRTFGVELQYRF